MGPHMSEQKKPAYTMPTKSNNRSLYFYDNILIMKLLLIMDLEKNIFHVIRDKPRHDDCILND